MTICIVDTSILDDLLNVPGWAGDHPASVAGFDERQKAREAFLLPLAVLMETGNHVAQVPNGGARRAAAQRFAEFARAALEGRSPFVATPLPTVGELNAWLDDFPDHAMRGVGLADRSQIALWEMQRDLLRGQRRVYIWTRDEHLASYDTQPLIR